MTEQEINEYFTVGDVVSFRNGVDIGIVVEHRDPVKCLGITWLENRISTLYSRPCKEELFDWDLASLKDTFVIVGNVGESLFKALKNCIDRNSDVEA